MIAVVDPGELRWFGAAPIELPTSAAWAKASAVSRAIPKLPSGSVSATSSDVSPISESS